jgi:hypothetical protein
MGVKRLTQKRIILLQQVKKKRWNEGKRKKFAQQAN